MGRSLESRAFAVTAVTRDTDAALCDADVDDFLRGQGSRHERLENSRLRTR